MTRRREAARPHHCEIDGPVSTVLTSPQMSQRKVRNSGKLLTFGSIPTSVICAPQQLCAGAWEGLCS